MSDHSFITLDSEVVAFAARTKLEQIREARSADWEKEIAGRMRRRKYWLFGRRLTRDEAIASLKCDSCLSTYEQIFIFRYGQSEGVAMVLLAASKAAKQICVTLNDADRIGLIKPESTL